MHRPDSLIVLQSNWFGSHHRHHHVAHITAENHQQPWPGPACLKLVFLSLRNANSEVSTECEIEKLINFSPASFSWISTVPTLAALTMINWKTLQNIFLPVKREHEGQIIMKLVYHSLENQQRENFFIILRFVLFFGSTLKTKNLIFQIFLAFSALGMFKLTSW